MTVALEPDQEHDAASLSAVTLAALSVPPTDVIELPARPGVTADWPDWVPDPVRTAVLGTGITRLWRHQREAADAVHAGEHVVLTTGTASGKSLAYWLPALSAIIDHNATVLYCTPTKALAQDQLSRLRALQLAGLTPATFDGDTDQEARPYVRRTANYILTNPDMLHRSILPGHAKWSSFLRRLQVVVLDEGHHYRGVFGSHVAAVVRRLRHVAQHHGAQPMFVVCSATMPDPESAADRLLGMTATAITTDTSTRPETTLILSDPASAPTDDPPSAFSETAALLRSWVAHDASSLGFMRSRAGVEALAKSVSGSLPAELADRVTAYRGGLLPEERRAIESDLRDGRLRAVASTNALELGVDITGLDAVAMCGWPGTRLSFLQQMGRAGRTDAPAVAVLLAGQDPLDRYLVSHPERILTDPLESFVFDPQNPNVLGPHLAACAAEVPLTTDEATDLFGSNAAGLLAALQHQGLLRLRGDLWYWVARGRPSDSTDLRGAGSSVLIVESGSGRVMGTVDGGSAPAQVHEGAVYTHLGRIHLVETFDIEAGVATVRRVNPGFTTVAQSTSDLRITSVTAERALAGGHLAFGEVLVTAQVVGYLKRQAGTGRVIGSAPLDLPPAHLTTKAVWWTCAADDLRAAGISARQIPGAAHAAEHAAISLLPALATCDRWDIGGLSTDHHPDTGTVTVFVYDGHPGGAGFAERGFAAVDEWLCATRDAIATCPCDHGCPGCVQSPKCGNGNEPLSKAGAVKFLTFLLGPARLTGPEAHPS